MSDTEKLLEENIVDYEAAKRAAGGYLEENYAELSRRFCYAEKLSLPVRENQAFFVWDEGKPGADLIKLLMERLPGVCGGDLRLIYYGKGGVQGGIRYDSEEYWEALACSGYLISNIPLPVVFVKREGQTYFNALSIACESKSFRDFKEISHLTREILKTDVMLGSSAGTVRETWGEKSHLLGIYGGTVLLCEEPAAHAREIAEGIVKSAQAKKGIPAAEVRGISASGSAGESAAFGVRRFVPENAGKRRILVLTAWKMPTEQTYLVKRLLADPALSDCSVTVLSSLADDPELLADFAALPGQEPRLMYRGRMVLAEQDVLTWRILEKNPDACVSCPELDAERDRLIRREWRRIWGSLHFDVCLVLGGLGWQQYHMAMAGNFEKRILIDLDFLDNFREKAPARWNRALTGFDEIFCLPAGKGLGAYGAENKDRVRRLPVFSPQKNSVGDGIFAGGASETKISGDENGKSVSPALSGEPLEYCGSEYIVLGCRRDGARKRLILLKLPASGAVLGRDGFRVDDRFWKYLYFLPAADCFFDRLSGCVRNAALEYDAVSEICRTRGVPILTEGNFPCGAK